MKVADNLDRHDILDEFEFRQDRTIHPSAKKPRIRLCPEHILCNFYPVFMKLADS